MGKKGLRLLIISILALSLSGCATTKRKQNEMEMQGLKNQISFLETQLQAKDEEINSLKEATKKSQEDKEAQIVKSRKRIIPEIKSRPNVRQIQIALKNAGLNPGRIDAKLGKQTKDAIKEFQKANNLKADGKVGKKTWELLKEYLYKKIK
jgi:peptidoglycan hydrolase-like protein with peptidoglycan-binding domain